jgi:hypothetical protein
MCRCTLFSHDPYLQEGSVLWLTKMVEEMQLQPDDSTMSAVINVFAQSGDKVRPIL